MFTCFHPGQTTGVKTLNILIINNLQLLQVCKMPFQLPFIILPCRSRHCLYTPPPPDFAEEEAAAYDSCYPVSGKGGYKPQGHAAISGKRGGNGTGCMGVQMSIRRTEAKQRGYKLILSFPGSGSRNQIPQLLYFRSIRKSLRHYCGGARVISQTILAKGLQIIGFLHA